MWNYLKTQNKPIALYGTGNGAEKIMAELQKRNIKISCFFANDDFVRGQEFHGYKVLKYNEAKEIFGDMIVLLCYGSHLDSVIDQIKYIASREELYAPDVPVTGSGIFDKEYATMHKFELDRIYNLLCDDKSKTVFTDVITYKTSGKIDYLFHCETSEEESWELLNLSNNERYLDLGAYTGDTIDMFLKQVSDYENIIAVEPDNRNYRKLIENTENLKNFKAFHIAINDKKDTLIFTQGSGRGSSAKQGKPIDADSVDNILNGEPVTFIKFDVEGQEAKAIKGAERTIQKYKPKMLIAAYHRTEDLFDIPNRVLEINPNYKVFLRHTPCLPAWEINYIFI